MKINFGCGGNKIPDWINHDAEVPIDKPLPYPDNCADAIHAGHVVEHISHIKALGFLKECHRILRPGGVVKICIPVLDRLERGHAVDIICNHGHEAAYSSELIGLMLFAAGFEKSNIRPVGRSDIDGHFRVIGLEKDTQETSRWEATK